MNVPIRVLYNDGANWGRGRQVLTAAIHSANLQNLVFDDPNILPGEFISV